MSDFINKIMGHIRKTNGKFVYFSQGNYMDRYGWSGTDRTKLGGAWTGPTKNKDAQGNVIYGFGGACYGFSAAYLISPGITCNINQYFHLPKIQSIIRGVMNLQYQYVYVARMHTRLQKQDIFNDVVKIEGRLRFKGSEQLCGVTASHLMGALMSNGKQEISLSCSTAAHSVAVKVISGVISFFDSNFGEISYPNDFAGRMNMEQALNIVFRFHYYRYTKMVISNFS